MTETGWGEFTVQIRIQFIQESGEKPITLSHPIKLHHWGAPIEASPAAPATTAPVTANSTPAGTPKPEKSSTPHDKPEQSVKSEAATPAGEGEGDASVEMGEIRVPHSTELSAQISIASKYPVHSWQYDELVFSDPMTSFLNILNSNPPTPFPTKNRRARDQREAQELATKSKKPKVGSRSSMSMSRDPTIEPTGANGAVDVLAPGAGTVGIPGEPGSADVPLEFTLEMEKAEHNRLNDARIKIVEQMDKWRCAQPSPCRDQGFARTGVAVTQKVES